MGRPLTPPPPKWRASMYTGPNPTLPPDFVTAVQDLEKVLKRPVWLLIQNEEEGYGSLGPEVENAFFGARKALSADGPIALLIDSPGGGARHAYRVARILRDHAGGFVAVVPLYAKSAATLLTLGADEIILSEDAELGPLDAQYYDYDLEERASALEEVQALERIHSDGLKALDATVFVLKMRTHKKTRTLLPLAMRFVADMLRPMMEKIDTVHFSKMQRILKVAEDYAIRLLQPKYSEKIAKKIAAHLVSKYSEHEFIIDAAEAQSFGLRTSTPSPAQMDILERLMPYLNEVTAIGRLEEVPP